MSISFLDEVKDDYHAFVQVHFTSDVLEVAQSLPGKYGLRGSDTVHLASAIILRSLLSENNDPFPFITSDIELGRTAKRAEFAVYDPNEVELPA